jgi:hypothetical protein
MQQKLKQGLREGTKAQLINCKVVCFLTFGLGGFNVFSKINQTICKPKIINSKSFAHLFAYVVCTLVAN